MELQESKDIVEYWIAQVLEHRGKDAELSLKFSQDIIRYGLTNQDNRLLGIGYFYCSETYYLLNDTKNFAENINQALHYLELADESELVGKCYNYMGILSMNNGSVTMAMEHFYKGIEYCRNYGLWEQEAIMDINVGNLNNKSYRFEEGQTYLERALDTFKAHPEMEDYHIYMVYVYENLAKSLIHQGKLSEVEEMFYQIYHNHWKYLQPMDQMVVWCTEALFFEAQDDTVHMNQRIKQIQSVVSKELPILDVFDDLYDYMHMLLRTNHDDEMWQIVEIMDELSNQVDSLNLLIRLLALKINYYNKHGQNAEYLQATALFYGYSQKKEEEDRKMVDDFLNLRQSLDEVNRAKKEMEVENRILMEKSEMDPLTKIANRFRLADHSEELFRRAIEAETSYTIEMLDVDCFKEFNDNYGHQAGDHCLREVAEAIKTVSANHGGFCARYGGDEFVIVYENLSKDEAFAAAAELKATVLGRKVPHEFTKAKTKQVTVSQGLCWGFPKPGMNLSDFLHTADNNLYKIKQVSRNNYCLGEFPTEGVDELVGPMED